MKKQHAVDSIEGVWQMVRAEHDGNEAPALVVQRTKLRLVAGLYSVDFHGKTTDKGTYELPSEEGATSLVLHGKSGPNSGRTIRCIFQQVRDRLRVCYGLDGIQPHDFTTRPGQNRYVATYRRVLDRA